MESKDNFILYHRTQPDKVLDILRSNCMLPSTRSWFEKPRVSFTSTPNLTEFGSVVIVFDGNMLINETPLREFDYSMSMQQYFYEKEWFVEGVVDDVRKFILYIDFNIDIDYDFDTIEEIQDWAKEISKLNIGFSRQGSTVLKEL